MTVSDFDVAVTGEKEILEVVTVTFTCDDVTTSKISSRVVRFAPNVENN